MQTLKSRPRTAIVVGIMLVALVATVIVFIWMRGPEARMQAAGGYGIVPYELAFTPARAGEILAAWGTAGQQAARSSLLIDFAFMPSYALAFAAITLLIARGQSGRLGALGLTLTPAPLVAALFDATENLILLSMLGQTAPPALPPLVAGLCASIKFLLLIVALVYWIVSGVVWVVRRMQPASAS